MTSIERISVAAMMAVSAAVGAAGITYLRPMPPQVIPSIAAAPVQQPAPLRTVTWFKAHPDEINVKLAACYDSPGTGQHDPECVNASTAMGDLSAERDMAKARALGIIK